MWLREVVEGILFRNRSDSLFLKHDENNNDRILKRMTIQSMRGRADWSYWRIDDWKQWSLAFVFRNTIILWNTCNEGQIGRPHSPRWIAQWTEWLCSCPSPILMGRMSCPSPSRHTEGDKCAAESISLHPLEWCSRRKKPRLSTNSRWWLCIKQNSDGKRRAHPMLNRRRSIRVKTTRFCVLIEQYSISTQNTIILAPMIVI